MLNPTGNSNVGGTAMLVEGWVVAVLLSLFITVVITVLVAGVVIFIAGAATRRS